MNNIWQLTRMNTLISWRSRIVFFFTVVFPMLFFFVYFTIFAKGNPQVVAYLMGELVGLSVISSASFGLSNQMVMMRERDMLRRYHLAPVSAFQMIASRLVSNYILFIPIVALQYWLAVAIYHMPIHGSLTALWLIYTLAYFSLGAIGLVVAAVVNTFQEATVLNQLLFLGLLFLSGSTVPIGDLSPWLRHFALFLPPTLMIVSSTGILMHGQSLMQHLPEVVGLTLSLVTAMGLSVALFRWEKDQKATPRQRRQALLALLPIIVVGIWLNHSPTFLNTNRAMLTLTSDSH